MEIFIQGIFLVVGFVMLIKGADWFVYGASNIADRFGIPQIVIGLTIVAMGTSAPEAAVSISSALKGSAGITIGNVVGSNILNILVILGITSLVRNISVKEKTIRYEIPFMIIISVMLTVLGLFDNEVSRLDGGILWGCMVLYLIYLLKTAKAGKEAEPHEIKEKKKSKTNGCRLIVSVICGVILIVWGSDVAVNSASEIARFFGLSERIIGLTIVAFGTSLPELVTSITAAMKGNADIAVGNVVGSNIFNILFVVGTTALISPVVYSSSFLIDSMTMIASTILMMVCVIKSKKLNKVTGVVMACGYVVYFVYLVL